MHMIHIRRTAKYMDALEYVTKCILPMNGHLAAEEYSSFDLTAGYKHF